MVSAIVTKGRQLPFLPVGFLGPRSASKFGSTFKRICSYFFKSWSQMRRVVKTKMTELLPLVVCHSTLNIRTSHLFYNGFLHFDIIVLS